jgi:2-keto-4-pentenoate hydratase/2-oxohepta-3-ene-1,7-dioic acid hydratase in catechol pathway
VERRRDTSPRRFGLTEQEERRVRFVRFSQDRGVATGVLDGTTVVDVSQLLSAPPATLGGAELTRLLRAFEADGDRLPQHDLESVQLRSPIPRPGKVVCIGLNYRDHAEESGMPYPDEPIVFFKAPNAMCGPYDDLQLPPEAEKVDWEVELGVVIGEEARYLPDPAAAREVIAGYCVSNDVSERAYQLERGGQWVKGKSCESFQPTGPWLVTADEVEDPQELDLQLWVNGELMQSGRSADMIFGVEYLIWYLSQFMVLEPGDLVNTGTPAGVGMGQTPARFLTEDDVVELEITGLGRQRQRCRRAQKVRSEGSQEQVAQPTATAR